MTFRIAASLLTLIAVGLFIACGGDDDSSDPSASASPTTTAVATPPPLADPQLPSGLREVARGDLGEIEVPVGGVYYIDPRTLAARGTIAPPCEGFVFAFSWQLNDPYPPEEESFEWQVQRDGGNASLSTDEGGQESVGCESLQAVNKGEEPLTVEVRYVIGAP